MTVIGLQDFISTAVAGQVKPATLSASAASSPAVTQTPASANQLAALTTSIPSQSLDTASFNNASVSVAQYSSVIEVAQGGADDISSLLNQLQNLAAEPAAGQTVSTATLAQINSQFQQVLAQISKISTSTTYNGASLLDGTFSTNSLGTVSPDAQNSASNSETLPDLTTQALFGATQPNLLTPEAAAQAYSLVSGAKDKVNQVSSSLGDTQNQLEFASASLQTALTNIDASTATLSPDDIAGTFENLLNNLTSQPGASAQLQASNISPTLLGLLQE